MKTLSQFINESNIITESKNKFQDMYFKVLGRDYRKYITLRRVIVDEDDELWGEDEVFLFNRMKQKGFEDYVDLAEGQGDIAVYIFIKAKSDQYKNKVKEAIKKFEEFDQDELWDML